ncbi:hypothetical protein DFP72DRAFT_1174002 [Ephemerocybe angulata]|uniref:Chromo domain-containing protein n=1 Tax=Ephemerocybe angulata TaxID=980116 RepID=A0A8H6M226_9AGAR|nr:hypothetical protein DFP72DRAFT_1174002 [Tulosesus angulatus]
MPYNPDFKRPPLAHCVPDVPPLPPEIDANGNKTWYINNIVDSGVEDNVVIYRVRWLTYPPEDDTWETGAALQGFAALRRWHYYQQIPVEIPIATINASRPSSNTPV